MWVQLDSGAAGYYGGYNVSLQATITNRTYQMAWPLWDGGTSNSTLVAMAAAVVGPPTFALLARTISRKGRRRNLPKETETRKWTMI